MIKSIVIIPTYNEAENVINIINKVLSLPVSFDVLPLKNKISFSKDFGESWSVPNVFNVLNKPLEISGPCIQLATGRILAACPPFHLGETGHSGWIIYSDDNGKSWNKLSEFFNSPNGEIAAWECRLCEIDNNGVAVIFWTYNNIKKMREEIDSL